MCGIAAIFSYGSDAPPVDADELIAIRDRMRTRGPDGEGLWISPDRRVGLAHRRLSIIDLSDAGAQPMWNADRTLAIVFNGEIYNYAELRSGLLARGYPFQSHSDTEVILALYEKKGADLVNDLRGMFAFALWDARKQGMLLARDPFGIKPLYYANDGRTIRIASQVKALRAGGAIDLAPDPAGHVGYFLWGHVPGPFTVYKNIRSLSSGHTAWVDRGGLRDSKVFCDIASILADAEMLKTEKLKSRNPDSIGNVSASQRLSISASRASDLRAALTDTVRHHLVADVPVGVFLSAGLDSTAIAALAAEQGGNLRTVTLGFEEFRGTPSDEVPLAEQFAQRCGAQHQTVWISRGDFEAERDNIFDAMDRPSTDGVNTYFVSLAAKRAGLKVALSGVGGDELFAGYPSFREIPRMVSALSGFRSWQKFGRDLRVVSAPVLKRFTSPKYAGLFEYGSTYGGAYLLRRGMFMPWELPELLDPDLVREGWRDLQTLLRLEETHASIKSPRLKVSALEMNWYMRHQLLRDTDWAGMGHSLEIRTPFVDVELLQQLAPLLVQSPAPDKRAMAMAASPLIDEEMLQRRKTGFQIPVRTWLLSDQPTDAKTGNERGLRGWARHVYRSFPGSQLKEKARRRLPATALEWPDAPAVDTSLPTSEPSRILVFRIGQLGDTIVAIPAMRLVKKAFPHAYLALLCDHHPEKEFIVASSLFRGSHLFDEYLSYPVTEGGSLLRSGRVAQLLSTIRRKKFDTLVYLAPSSRRPAQVARDRRFFGLAGIRNFIGMSGFDLLPPKEPGRPLPVAPRESDLLLHRLAVSDLKVEPSDAANMDLELGDADEDPFRQWRAALPDDGGRPWLAIGPGSKMPAKRWPLHRYERVVSDLIAEFDLWPVVFGGKEDRVVGEWLLKNWGRGYNAAGALKLRPSLVAMQKCTLFLGNDTGTMHMAAAAGLPCVAIFSSREAPGIWYPNGRGHRVFRTTIECEGCGLIECLERGNECLKRIGVEEVTNACREILAANVISA